MHPHPGFLSAFVASSLRSLLVAVIIATLLLSACNAKGAFSGLSRQNSSTAEIAEERGRSAQKYSPAQAYNHYLRGKKLELNKAWEQALDEYSLALVYERRSPRLLYDAARMLLFLDRISEAEELLEEASVLSTDWPDPHYLLGEIYFQTGRPERAVATFDHAINADPYFTPAYRRKAEVLYILKGREAAVAVYEDMVHLSPADVQGWVFLAENYRLNQEYDKLQGAMERILRLDPENTALLKQLIDWYVKTHQYRQAIVLFQKALKSFPGNRALYIKLGRLYLLSGEDDPAEEKFSKALELDTDDKADTLAEIGFVLIDTEKYEQAAAYFRRILDGGENTLARYFHSYSLFKTGKYVEAINGYSMISEDDAEFYADARADMALAYLALGEEKKSESILAGLLAAYPQDERVYRILSARQEELGNIDRAIEIMRIGLREIPRNVDLLFSLGLMYERNGEREKAMDCMYEVVAIDSAHADALNFLGFTYADSGQRLDEAEKLVRQALRYKPDEGYIIDSLGWIYYRRGEFDKAVR